MDTGHKLMAGAMVLTALAALTLLTTSCEDSLLIAPSDGEIILTANPQRARVDPDGLTARSNVSAQVLDADGRLLRGVSVFLTASSGNFLLSTGQDPLETDNNGIVEDVIVMDDNDDALITITAQSSSLTATRDVENPLGIGNQVPSADLIASPPPGGLTRGGATFGQESGGNVRFDASGSEDPDGQIECYKWTITSSLSQTPLLQTRGEFLTAIDRQFFGEQRVSALLELSDNPSVECRRDSAPDADANKFNASTSIIDYLICENTEPVANAGPSVQATLAPGDDAVFVQLDGSGSTDAETPDPNLLRFEWACGNGEQGAPPAAITECRYAQTGTFVVTLTVIDRGNGENRCAMRDNATTIVEVRPGT